MPESVVSFQSLPPEYQQVIRMAEERYAIAISPLQELAGGLSGAIIYLVRVITKDSAEVQHLILKLDRKRPMYASDEVARHKSVQQKSPPQFVRLHIPDIAYDRVELENSLAIFYTIAGQSLHNYRTLSKYSRQMNLVALFSATNHYLLEEWNSSLTFEQVNHPQQLLKMWLGFRLEPGQRIETFLREVCLLSPQTQGFIVEGCLLPNPAFYGTQRESWGSVRPLDAAHGLQHSDLNTNNILAKFSRQQDKLEGYYLIDFALFKEDMPLFFDQRYLEMSYLIHSATHVAYSSTIDLICRFSEHDFLEADQTPIEMVGVNAAIQAGRLAFEAWVQETHPSLRDDLWGQYWLAGTAAGLNFCNKAGLADDLRLAGLIYAAANLKRYFNLFGIPMPAEARQLSLQSQGEFLPRVEPALPSPKREHPNNLPTPPTNFIGRKIELAEVTALLLRPEVRLVTLTGPGGTGKTRLGLEAGRVLLDHFRDGVFFIDLAQVSDPSLVPTTTAHAIGMREGGSRPALEALKDLLAAKRMLLIFDNFEQVSEAALDVSRLLDAAPGVKALVTSRISLQVRAEHEYPVSPLELPHDLHLPVGETIEFESIALFLQQANAVRPGFEITEENRAVVIEICRRLDGLPLAIEIAAVRIKMLTPQALLKRLDQRLSLLVSGAKDLPDRQQTLRQTIEWSYNLLKAQEQALFTRFGVFAGGFTLEAAEEICKTCGGIDIYFGIETLLNNNLLRQVHSASDEPRYDMLQIIRDYALEKAAEADQLSELRWAHCDYFTQLAAGVMGQGIFGAQSKMWMQRYDEESDNYRLALAWALEHPDEGIYRVILMFGQLGWFWYRSGTLREGTEWAERALAATAGMSDLMPRAVALSARAYLALWSGDLIVAEQYARESIEIGQRLSLDTVISASKLVYGTALINQGKDKEAYPHLVDAVELFDGQDQSWEKGATLVHLANVSLGLGDANQALEWLDTAMPLLKASGDIWNMAFGLNNYGEVARSQGDYERAEGFYQRTRELYEQADAKGDQARLVHTFGYIAQHKGNFMEARTLFLRSLHDFREMGNHRGIAECLAGLAGLAAEQGKHAWAAPLLSAAESLLSAFGGAWWPADRVEIERARQRMQSTLGNRYEMLWNEGRTMSVEEAIAYPADGGGSP